jgi:hypothetical protein
MPRVGCWCRSRAGEYQVDGLAGLELEAGRFPEVKSHRF